MTITLLPRPQGLARPPEADDEQEISAGRRLVPVAAAATLFLPIADAWSSVTEAPAASLCAIGLLGADLIMIVLLLTVSDLLTLRRLERWLLVLAGVTLIVLSAGFLSTAVGYGSDEAALTQGAARALLAGHDPYGSNLTSALTRYLSTSVNVTQLLNGGVVHTYSYPALPMLVVTPFVELTGGGQAVPIASALVLVLAMLVMYRCLPDGFKTIAVIICAGSTILWMGSMNGMTGIIETVPLTYVAAVWTRVGREGQFTRPDWGCAICLGLAVSTNQIAWLLAPFALVGIYLVNAGRRDPRAAWGLVVRFGALTCATFLIINGPFILWSPEAWLTGVRAPLTQHAIPLGEGLVGLVLFARVGGGDISAYSLAAAVALAGGLVSYAIWFRKLGRACFALPLVAVFLAPRSLGSYWMFLVTVLVTAAATDDRVAFQNAMQLSDVLPRRWLPVSLTATALAPTIACLLLALLTPAPLAVGVLSDHGQASSSLVTAITVEVTNTSSRAIVPRFAVSSSESSGPTPFWRVLSGPQRLRAGETATFEISAQDASYGVQDGSRFLVYALDAQPESVSSSPTTVAGAETTHR